MRLEKANLGLEPFVNHKCLLMAINNAAMFTIFVMEESTVILQPISTNYFTRFLSTIRVLIICTRLCRILCNTRSRKAFKELRYCRMSGLRAGACDRQNVAPKRQKSAYYKSNKSRNSDY